MQDQTSTSFFLLRHSNRIITLYPEQIQFHSIVAPLRTNKHPFSLLTNLLTRKDRIAIRPEEKKGRGGREKEMKDLDPFLSYLPSRSEFSTTRFGSHFALVTSPNLAATFSCLLLPVRRIMKIRRRRAEPSRIIVAVFLRRIISAAIRRPRRGLGREEGKEGGRGRSLSRHDPPTHARTQFSTTFQPPLIDIPIAISVGIISRCR